MKQLVSITQTKGTTLKLSVLSRVKKLVVLSFIAYLFLTLHACAQGIQEKHDWEAHWITCHEPKQDSVNTWTAYRKTFTISGKPLKAILDIAVDSKYWLWINGKMVVFEGGLKRGPSPDDTYYDELDLTTHLKSGVNTIAILVWYFGKDGFSHHSSGRSGLLFELTIDDKDKVISGQDWLSRRHSAYIHLNEGPQPNFRLPESNVIYDARKNIGDWTSETYQDSNWSNAIELGKGGRTPWNHLFKRPIPQWKDYGLKNFEKSYPFTSKGDTIKCTLPYNAQITPYLEIEAKAGEKVYIQTDNYKEGTENSVRAEYIAKEGRQNYESLGWMNGHEVWFSIPPGVKIYNLGYRETGYNTTFSGSFQCEDPFYNRLWEKACRTLYITMRDNYMDCPDRERAQWWGDEVNEMGESFYALDSLSYLLARKGIYELINWQKRDGSIFSPIPAGNYDKELPMQMLNAVGYYGFWTYFKYTGDIATIQTVLPGVKKYLSLWKLGNDGLVIPRQGGWTWGDWGENKDMTILFNTWYYLACKGYALMSATLNEQAEASWAKNQMRSIEQNFNRIFWTGNSYRSPQYKGKTDDRANAMAVLCGFPNSIQYPQLKEVLIKEKHASPYMEKYVLEAFFQMGEPEAALLRMKKRFSNMVESELTTMWEGWELFSEVYGGGTYNHAWSGGGLTLLSQYVAGIEPASPGFQTVKIHPQMGYIKQSKAEINSVAGTISVQNIFKGTNEFEQKIISPSPIYVYFPLETQNIKSVKINGNEMSGVQWRFLKEKGYIHMEKGTYEIILKTKS